MDKQEWSWAEARERERTESRVSPCPTPAILPAVLPNPAIPPPAPASRTGAQRVASSEQSRLSKSSYSVTTRLQSPAAASCSCLRSPYKIAARTCLLASATARLPTLPARGQRWPQLPSSKTTTTRTR